MPKSLPSAKNAKLLRIAQYDENAAAFSERYEAVEFEEVHPLIPALPKGDARALDVGAGSGRDSAALAKLGYKVTAVEPSGGIRAIAQRLHTDPNIEWVDDQLPELAELGDRQFDLILVSAVWMHFVPNERLPAMQRLAGLLANNGFLVFSIRLGPADPSRDIFCIDRGDFHDLARQCGLALRQSEISVDSLGRPEFSWYSAIFHHGK